MMYVTHETTSRISQIGGPLLSRSRLASLTGLASESMAAEWASGKVSRCHLAPDPVCQR